LSLSTKLRDYYGVKHWYFLSHENLSLLLKSEKNIYKPEGTKNFKILLKYEDFYSPPYAINREVFFALLNEYKGDEAVKIQYCQQNPGDLIVVYPETYHIVLYVSYNLYKFKFFIGRALSKYNL
jgi:hypothetical protein